MNDRNDDADTPDAMHAPHAAVLDALRDRGLLDSFDAICSAHGVTRSEVMSRRRTKPIVLARNELWWLLYTHPEAPLNYRAIGRLFGRNRTSALRGVRAHHLARRALARASRPGLASIPASTGSTPGIASASASGSSAPASTRSTEAA